MTDNKASTPEEKPLHDIVLELMFEANKERPAQLTAKDVFWKFTDATVTENNVIEVLKWLLHQKRVEYAAGKYSLDRFEFLDQRRISNAEIGPDGKLILPDLPKNDAPLHEVILKLMFEADEEKPVELTADDIYWKISDPSVLKAQVGEVLKWLLHHKRVDFRAGKYSLDRFEFLDQTKIEKKAKKEGKPKKVPKTAAKPAKEETKISKAPKQTKAKEPVNTPKAVKKTNVPKPEPISTPKEEKVKSSPKPVEKISPPETMETEKVEKGYVNTILLSIAAVFFAYTFYLLLSSSSVMAPESSSEVQDEIVSAESRLKELSLIEPSSSSKDIAEERLNLIQEIALKNSELLANRNNSNHSRLRSLLVRLFLSNSIILLVFATVYYRGGSFRMGKRSKN